MIVSRSPIKRHKEETVEGLSLQQTQQCAATGGPPAIAAGKKLTAEQEIPKR